ncbi:hypothetical protein DQE82_26840 [Micromonospora sp. LHW51205]|uniref:helix-turn-helix transcriptional regulator n=1 Tax=Micromonospora sp. LHW51205 TaxID=2248752 RepID=UPI000DE91D68|nr:helix-turn-helix transcriptional regulator [Micromonospora sp. LHW51205]RBQ05167.1 hypothetical protein DQE82_26840 [Micromonospora sp. LHW51205]
MAMTNDPDLARVPGYRHVRARVTNGAPEVTGGMWRIREWRRRAGLTQQQAADLLGVHPGRVCAWETGRTTVPLAVLAAVADLAAEESARHPPAVKVNHSQPALRKRAP